MNKKIIGSCLALTVSFSMLFSTLTFATEGIDSNSTKSYSTYATSDTNLLKAKYVYTTEEFKELQEIEAKNIFNNQDKTTEIQSSQQNVITPQVAYYKYYNRFAPSNRYMNRTKYRLGTCQFRNSYSQPVIGVYTQTYGINLSASLNVTVSAHADAKAAVLSYGGGLSTSVTLAASVSAGTSYSASTSVLPGNTVTFTAYMAGICVDGSIVYKCYDLDNSYIGEITEPASNNWIISPIDLTMVIS